MTPKEIAQAIEALILLHHDDYLKIIAGLEEKLYTALSRTLHDLEIDSEGYIKQNAANRKIIQLAEADFNNTILSRSYEAALQNYVAVIPEIDKLNARYFTEVSKNYVQNKIYLKNLRASTLETLETLILREGVDVNIKLQIMDIVSNGINTGSSYNGLVKEVREFVKGDANGGRLMAYVKTLTKDAMFNYSRAYQQSIVTQIKFDFYLFSGGLQHTSRSFCLDRSDKFFSQKEIESWASLDWPGKRKGTTESSIFIYCGGYNCTHSLIPVDVSVVPKEDVDRAVELGFIKQANKS